MFNSAQNEHFRIFVKIVHFVWSIINTGIICNSYYFIAVGGTL